ncbi:hypothetical protein LguiA_008014 [Lonicera macranthoides]
MMKSAGKVGLVTKKLKEANSGPCSQLHEKEEALKASASMGTASSKGNQRMKARTQPRISGMTRKRPMTASERQRKSKKHCVVTAAKQHGETKKLVTLTPPEIENDTPSQNEPQCEGNNDPLSTQIDPQNEENPSHLVAPENPQIEGLNGSDKGPSAGPIDKSVLTSFNDHIAYAIWNQTKKTKHYMLLAKIAGMGLIKKGRRGSKPILKQVA